MRYRVTKVERSYVEVDSEHIESAFDDGYSRLSYGYSDSTTTFEIEKIGP